MSQGNKIWGGRVVRGGAKNLAQETFVFLGRVFFMRENLRRLSENLKHKIPTLGGTGTSTISSLTSVSGNSGTSSFSFLTVTFATTLTLTPGVV